MDEQAKKTALRMIPYGLYVLGVGKGERSTLSTVNWLTQASFQPPLVVVGVKQGTHTYDLLKEHGAFAVSVLGTGQKDIAFAFFRHVEPKEGKFGDYEFETAVTGAPILRAAPAWFECRLTDTIERGDHAIVVGEVIEAGVRAATKALTMEECGVTYGG
ncbi:MAG: flavin reductase family protein [Chloroflexota bacterium]|jgi:flavin reductase (DIM6/NTAB) family NADH-FMN oxidoreductase RutF|nr:flavin reductase family protein [Dehalococcoidia bacterium]MDW8046296.1 flavin reductase family protein [Chloroflexota bacterium]